MEVHVDVKMVITLMGLYVCYVSMARYGILLQILVNVQVVLCGMVIIARDQLFVQEIVSIMKQWINVYVLISIFGMDIAVWFSLIVVVVRYGIRHRFNVIALIISIGMEQTVYFV